MNCKNCNEPIEDGVTFCPNCGTRVDGKKACEQCGQMNDENQKFCSNCGARIDGKTVCQKCGTEYKGRFCPSCGLSARAVERTAVKQEAAVAANRAPGRSVAVNMENNATMLTKVMRILSKSLAFFGAAMTLIFVFFLGFAMDYSGEGYTISKSIFYFFIENMKIMANMVKWYEDGITLVVGIFYYVLCFLLALGVLVLVLVFGIIAIVKFVKSFSNENDTIKASFRVMFWYILGAVLLASLHISKTSWGKMVFNGATVACMVLCAVAIVGSLTCKLLENPCKFKEKSFLVGKVVALSCAAISLVVLIIAANTGVGSGGERRSAILKGDLEEVKFVGVIAQILQMAAISIFTGSLFRMLKVVTDEEENGELLSMAIVSSALSVVSTVLMIVVSNKMDGKANVAMPIVLIVFSLIYLGAIITKRVIVSKYDETDFSDGFESRKERVMQPKRYFRDIPDQKDLSIPKKNECPCCFHKVTAEDKKCSYCGYPLK